MDFWLSCHRMNYRMHVTLISLKRKRNWVREQSIAWSKPWSCFAARSCFLCSLHRAKVMLPPRKCLSCSSCRQDLFQRQPFHGAPHPHHYRPPHHCCCSRSCCRLCIFFDTLCSWRNTPNYWACVLRDCNVSWHFQDVSFFEKRISTRWVKRLIFQTRKLSLAQLCAGGAWTHCLESSVRRPECAPMGMVSRCPLAEHM